MEKRALLAVVLSLAFFYGYSLLFPAPEKKVSPKPVQKIASSVTTVVSVPVQAAKPVQQKALGSKDAVVETDQFTAVFSCQGGTLKSLVLKKYRETSGTGGEPVALVSENSVEGFALKTGSTGFPLDPAAIYSPSDNNLRVTGNETKRLDFSWTSPQGAVVTKSYTFSGAGYEIGLDTRITNNGSGRLTGVLTLALPHPVEPKSKQSRFENNSAVTRSDGKFSTEAVKDIPEKPKKYVTSVEWTGYADKYFLSAVLSKDGSIGSAAIEKGSGRYLNTIISSPTVDLNPGQTGTVAYRLFFGPKDLDILKAQGAGLEQSLDLGWFAPLAKPLLYTLKFFNKYTHNYGIAIIIITIIIKILFFPLTHKSYKSMKDMQKLQPKMAEVKEKFKNDRDAMNKAVMELYRTHKVNPLGGCLPMVVQIPVFFALYKALMFSIELRHAPFLLWITDLSAKDPYYVTPIIMGVTMFIQQKMTPSTMDPIQAKMMLALPVVFTFMFLNFPAGLVIYWLVNNILTIAQQSYINHSLKD
jgi:YidC/Oxa1 family membrane protein insertase